MEIRNFSDKIIPNFPQELVLEILARLPLTSLLRFQSICKSWRSLITSQYFIDSHLTVSTKVIFATGSSSSSSSSYTIKYCSLNSMLSGTADDDAQTVDFDFPLKNHKSIEIVGCCNDLICIAINRSYFCLWNQSTRKLKKLPDWDNELNRDIHSYGFGFDDSNGDYKVFASSLISYKEDYPPEYTFDEPHSYRLRKCDVHEMKVYSLQLNSWKRIESYHDRGIYHDDGLPLTVPGKFVRGKLHWGNRTVYSTRPQVFSLDLANEVWECTDFPVCFMGCVSKSLGILGGCLAMLPEFTDDVWILKQDGENKVWKKVFRFTSYNLKELSYHAPIYILPDGRIVYLKRFYFMIYDPKDKSVDRVRFTSSNRLTGAKIYIKSFCSSTSFFSR